MDIDDDFFEKYLEIIKNDEEVLHNECKIEIESTDPYTFELIKGETNIFALKLANEIRNRMLEFEPTAVMQFKNDLYLGFHNPLPSKRITGELFKTKLRVKFEIID